MVEPRVRAVRPLSFMRIRMIFLAVVCTGWGQNAEIRIPPVKAAVALEGHPINITAWGVVKTAPEGFRLAMTVDLGEMQENLTPVLAAQLNKSERCGERLTVEKAELFPEAPGGVLTAHVHYERYACVKAFGKEMVKRLVGGNAVVEVALTPSVGERQAGPTPSHAPPRPDGGAGGSRIAVGAQVRKIDADGSLGEALRSGSMGDSLRQKIAASIENAIRKSANLEAALPAQVESMANLQSVRFEDGGAGRLWLALAGEVRLTPEQFRDLAKAMKR